MVKKVLSLLIALAMMLGIFTACGQKVDSNKQIAQPQAGEKKDDSQAGPKTPQIKLRLSESNVEGYPTTLGDEEFARLVEERTNGRIKIEVFPSGQLGGEKDSIEQVQFGAIDFARVSSAPLAEFVEEINVLMLPYIYRDAEHMWKVLDSDVGNEFKSMLERENFVGLAWYDEGARSFYNSKREIKTVSDLKGLKFRVQQSKLMMGLVSALGAVPTPMAPGEVYSALQTSVIDGAENNFPIYMTNSHYEVAKYFTFDEHNRIPGIIIGSKKVLNQLSEEDQEIIRQAAKESEKVQREAWAKKETEALEQGKAKGAIITYIEDNSEFREAVLPLYDEIAGKYKELIEKIQAVK